MFHKTRSECSVDHARGLVFHRPQAASHRRAVVYFCSAVLSVALFRAQNLETEIVNAMVIARLHEKDNISRQEIDAFMNRQRTLGQLLKELKKYVQANDELKQTLRDAWKKRNWLAHNYFKGRGMELMSSAGCNLMISELKEAEQLFLACRTHARHIR